MFIKGILSPIPQELLHVGFRVIQSWQRKVIVCEALADVVLCFRKGTLNIGLRNCSHSGMETTILLFLSLAFAPSNAPPGQTFNRAMSGTKSHARYPFSSASTAYLHMESGALAS